MQIGLIPNEQLTSVKHNYCCFAVQCKLYCTTIHLGWGHHGMHDCIHIDWYDWNNQKWKLSQLEWHILILASNIKTFINERGILLKYCVGVNTNTL